VEWHKSKRTRVSKRSPKTLTPDLGMSMFSGLVNPYQEFNNLIKLEIKTSIKALLSDGRSYLTFLSSRELKHAEGL